MLSSNQAILKDQLLTTFKDKLKAALPSSTKPQEKNATNYLFTSLFSGEKFQLDKNVTYIWLLTQNEIKDQDNTISYEPGEINFGVENPLMGNSYKAFHKIHRRDLKARKKILDNEIAEIKRIELDIHTREEKIKDKIAQAGFPGLGHPTLAIQFDKNSGASSASKGYIGGELYFENGSWYLNNRTGRFYNTLDNLQREEKKLLLECIAYQFSIHPCINSAVKVSVFTKSLESIWNKYEKIDGSIVTEVAIKFLLKSFNHNIPQRVDIVTGAKIKSDETPEYLEVKKTLFGKAFPDIESLVNYLNHFDDFMNEMRKIFKLHNQELNKELEIDLRKYIDFLGSKIKIDPSNAASPHSFAKKF